MATTCFYPSHKGCYRCTGPASGRWPALDAMNAAKPEIARRRAGREAMREAALPAWRRDLPVSYIGAGVLHSVTANRLQHLSADRYCELLIAHGVASEHFGRMRAGDGDVLVGHGREQRRLQRWLHRTAVCFYSSDALARFMARPHRLAPLRYWLFDGARKSVTFEARYTPVDQCCGCGRWTALSQLSDWKHGVHSQSFGPAAQAIQERKNQVAAGLSCPACRSWAAATRRVGATIKEASQAVQAVKRKTRSPINQAPA